MASIYYLSPVRRLEPELVPDVEVFHIEAESAAQAEDGGWYFWPRFAGESYLGDPEGPYPSAEIAREEAYGKHVR